MSNLLELGWERARANNALSAGDTRGFLQCIFGFGLGLCLTLNLGLGQGLRGRRNLTLRRKHHHQHIEEQLAVWLGKHRDMCGMARWVNDIHDDFHGDQN